VPVGRTQVGTGVERPMECTKKEMVQNDRKWGVAGKGEDQ